MEMNAQIGELVKQRQEERIALEHLKFKTKKIAAAFSAFAYAQDRWVANETGRGGVFLLYPKGDEREHPQYLLNQIELAQHIREVKGAEQALAKTTAQLRALGITG